MSEETRHSDPLHRVVRRLFFVVWSAWIDDGWRVERVKSWRSARLIHKTGRKQTITIMPIASWKDGCILGCSYMSLDEDNLAALKFLAASKRKKRNGIGRTRIKLAKIVSDSLGIDCQPEDLQPATGANRTNKLLDIYAWEVFARHRDSNIPFVAGCFETMGECVKAGKVCLIKGEIYSGEPSE